MLEKLLDVIDASSIEAVLADREFISSGWLHQMQQRKIPFCIRLRSDRRIGDSKEGPTLPARMFARLLSPGSERILEGRRSLFSTEGVPVLVRVVPRHGGSRETDTSFLVLATWKVDPGEATGLYRARWEIETMFAALKSRGFDLEATDLTTPAASNGSSACWRWRSTGHGLSEIGVPGGKGPSGQNPQAQRAEPLPLRPGPAAEHPDHAGATTEGVLRMPTASSKSDCVFGTYLGNHPSG